jgi:hypothetical protein
MPFITSHDGKRSSIDKKAGRSGQVESAYMVVGACRRKVRGLLEPQPPPQVVTGITKAIHGIEL